MPRTVRLYFLRHGMADHGPASGCDDDSRTLSPEGRRQLDVAAGLLAALELPCDLILCSPLVRAVQTAEIIADRLGRRDRMITDARLGCGCRLPDLATLLAERAADHRHLMLVGHQPDLSMLIGELTGGVVAMKPGALARVDLPESGRGRLVWLLQPELLAALV